MSQSCLLIELVGLHEGLVTAGLVALPLSEIFMNCLDVVPESVDALQHLATLITGLQVRLLILRMAHFIEITNGG